jgi:hypothetical protein
VVSGAQLPTKVIGACRLEVLQGAVVRAQTAEWDA